ncbi:hypothetical protein [Thiocapsa roseopersicina]|uniref:Uncharacterized protein n=1 Tax=Thiocapsa roseopersicina TaxID=1058 RepID=A0A1H2S2V7_THIRO|nr:hypothetical protein [Thiocapsa roseopersicina]SDW25941.1 hypothetical protein SAMN05421783_102266 [Thiocapsa roseopersicina]
MSMPLVVVLVAATTGIAATVAVFDGRVESAQVVPAVTASADSAEGWTRRGVRPVGAVQRPETIGTSSAGPRRGMRGSPERTQVVPVAGSGDWTRRGTRSVPSS